MPGRTMPRPPAVSLSNPPPTPGSPLPFLHEPTDCAGHDLLVLNARPDLAPEKHSPAHASLSNRNARQATAFLRSCFLQKLP
jgi:hypothetical protein